MNDDLKELLESLKSHGVEFLVVGGHAVSFHARPRMTEDLDLWIDRQSANVDRLRDALASFGAPISTEGAKHFAELDRQMVRIGVPPNMADLMNFGGSRPFSDVWPRRAIGSLEGIEVAFPSIEDLVDMKEGAGRPQDLADIANLRKAMKPRK